MVDKFDSTMREARKVVDATTTTTPVVKPNPTGSDTIFSEFKERYSNHDSVICDAFSTVFNFVPDVTGAILLGNNYSRSADSGIFGGIFGLGRSLIGSLFGGLFGGGTTPTGSGHINPNCPKHSTRIDADVLGRLKPTYLNGNLVYIDPNTGKQVDTRTALEAASKLGAVKSGQKTTFVDETTAEGVDGKKYVVKDGKWALEGTETAPDAKKTAKGEKVEQSPTPQPQNPEKTDIKNPIIGDFYKANKKGVVENPVEGTVYQNKNGKYYVCVDSKSRKYELATSTLNGKLYIEGDPLTGPNGDGGDYYHDGIKLEQKSAGDVKYFTKTEGNEISYYHEVNGKIVPFTGKLKLNNADTLILQGKPAAEHKITWEKDANNGYKTPAGEIAKLIEGLEYVASGDNKITIGPDGSKVTVTLLENGGFEVKGSETNAKTYVVKKDGDGYKIDEKKSS